MTLIRTLTAVVLAAAGAVVTLPTVAADACKNRGELDAMYCDANKDMVADVPADPKKWKNPSTIVFTYTPVEDPAVYENIFKPFTTHLAKCLDKKVVFYQVQTNAAEIEAMRSGRLHVGGFSTGPTAFAVNLAGAIPFAVKGNAKEFQGYNLIVIVKANSPYQKLADLKGKKVAHTSPSSNSGHLAPLCAVPRARASRRTRTTRSSSPASTTSRSWASIPATTTRRRSPPTSSTGWPSAARSRKPISASSTAARNSRRRRSPTRTISIRSSSTRCSAASTTIAFRRRWRRRSTAPTASSRSTTRRRGRSCATVAKGSGAGFDKATYDKETTREAAEAAKKK